VAADALMIASLALDMAVNKDFFKAFDWSVNKLKSKDWRFWRSVRRILLDTGANTFLVSWQSLSEEEQKTLDPTRAIFMSTATGPNAGRTMGTVRAAVELRIGPGRYHSVVIDGVHAIDADIPFLIPAGAMCIRQAFAVNGRKPELHLMDNEGSMSYFELPVKARTDGNTELVKLFVTHIPGEDMPLLVEKGSLIDRQLDSKAAPEMSDDQAASMETDTAAVTVTMMQEGTTEVAQPTSSSMAEARTGQQTAKGSNKRSFTISQRLPTDVAGGESPPSRSVFSRLGDRSVDALKVTVGQGSLRTVSEGRKSGTATRRN
jgi:hypothetical protein